MTNGVQQRPIISVHLKTETDVSKWIENIMVINGSLQTSNLTSLRTLCYTHLYDICSITKVNHHHLNTLTHCLTADNKDHCLKEDEMGRAQKMFIVFLSLGGNKANKWALGKLLSMRSCTETLTYCMRSLEWHPVINARSAKCYKLHVRRFETIRNKRSFLFLLWKFFFFHEVT